MTSPLDLPGRASAAAASFLERYPLERQRPAADLLVEAAAAFARFPYENLTKILKYAAAGSPERARRWPGEVISDHVALGAGGTCFSLTAAFLHILRALGFRAEPILADRWYGRDTHCAMLVWVDGRPMLLDPGYLITRPIPLDGVPVQIAAGFNELRLEPLPDGRIELSTVQGGSRIRRLAYRTDPADPGAFLRAWDASFGWEMMRYPVLSRVACGRQLYLQERRFQVRGLDGVSRAQVPESELPARIARDFGIDAAIAGRALRILGRSGEPLRS